ncbi:hypothetical protein D6783_03210 [Candidatus Woesearchaeota archaeon]|nr:MAG: hypothetical protein D6783_03210 [Candidatus Woesearchaeota archaeon]
MMSPYPDALKEAVAETIHNMWIEWSSTIADTEKISTERIRRWTQLWIPYSELPEAEKDKDRRLAHKIIMTIIDFYRKSRKNKTEGKQ